MKFQLNQFIGFIVLGAGKRLAVAALLIATLWLGFFWAIASPGGA